jgi:hypothetical protein
MRTCFCAAALLAAISSLVAVPANAAVIIINQTKALNGSVTPGDNPGFPVSITRSGSYRLDSNLLVTPDRHGIAINAPNVSIDLNGFTIDGKEGGLTGILGTETAPNVSVENGTIMDFRRDGISGDAQWTVKDMVVVQNEWRGIDLGNEEGARVLDSVVAGNTLGGINCGPFCHVEGSIIGVNSIFQAPGNGPGVSLESGAVIGNTIMLNGGFGIAVQNGAYGGNVLIDNNAHGPEQIAGTFVAIHPNGCNPLDACPPD